MNEFVPEDLALVQVLVGHVRERDKGLVGFRSAGDVVGIRVTHLAVFSALVIVEAVPTFAAAAATAAAPRAARARARARELELIRALVHLRVTPSLALPRSAREVGVDGDMGAAGRERAEEEEEDEEEDGEEVKAGKEGEHGEPAGPAERGLPASAPASAVASCTGATADAALSLKRGRGGGGGARGVLRPYHGVMLGRRIVRAGSVECRGAVEKTPGCTRDSKKLLHGGQICWDD